MLITTTNTLQGKEIVEYLGVASGQAIMGANVVRDFLAGITDVIGGRSGAYESKLNDAKEIALREMAQEARAMGGNAVIGVDLDFETIRDGMIMCIATGKNEGGAIVRSSPCSRALRRHIALPAHLSWTDLRGDVSARSIRTLHITPEKVP
nr:hypothetical protein [Bacillota bacterium]